VFEGLFARLRAQGVPVATDEWLLLQRALERGVVGPGLADLYRGGRALLVKSERHYDAWDVAFEGYFSGLEHAGEEVADHVWEWLAARPDDLRLTDEQRARLDAMLERLDLDELRERLRERLANQTEAHHGGSRHIGTGGTSPFGHSGYRPGGVRIGGEGRHRTASQVAAERRWRAYRDDATIGVRDMGVALRRLRALSSRLEGPETELDLDGTIEATADHGGRLRLVMRRPRRNAVRVLLLLDVGGSMDEHAELCDRLFSAVHQGGRFRDLQVRWFHNCVYDRVWTRPEVDPAHSESTLGLLARLGPDHKLVIVGDACMAPSELAMPGGAVDWWVHNDEPGWVWLERLRAHFTHAAWLNPVPARWWGSVHGYRTLNAVRGLFPMYELSLHGLESGVTHLMHPVADADRA
jgi:uncharacterized protein with von Willebrand factor type A (vWA) domain